MFYARRPEVLRYWLTVVGVRFNDQRCPLTAIRQVEALIVVLLVFLHCIPINDDNVIT